MDFIVARGLRKGIHVKNARKPREINIFGDGGI